MDNSDISIKVTNLTKQFILPHKKHNSIKQVFVDIGRRGKADNRKVLNDLSFEIKKGEFFGIVGRNGSGKSTLLKLLAGVYTPSKGSINIQGSLTPFIELGVGFNPELTGRDNIYLNGALLGFTHKQMESMYKSIVDFAELHDFMDQKLKNYSSGMQVRLAFSIAIRAQSDILLIDEVLAVGDAIFQKKCYDYFRQLKKNKKTVVFVSHDVGALEEYCTSGILIENGEIQKMGPIDKVVKNYLSIINRQENSDLPRSGLARWGTQKAIIKSMKIRNDKNDQLKFYEDQNIIIDVVLKAKQDIDKPVCGLTITDLTGQIMFQSNTLWCKKPVKDLIKNDEVNLTWVIPNAFNSGKYMISPAVSDSSGVEVYDWRDNLEEIEVIKVQKSHGVININHELKINYEKAV